MDARQREAGWKLKGSGDKMERRMEWNELLMVNNEIPMSWAVFLGCSKCPMGYLRSHGDPFSPRSGGRKGWDGGGGSIVYFSFKVANLAHFMSFSTPSKKIK